MRNAKSDSVEILLRQATADVDSAVRSGRSVRAEEWLNRFPELSESEDRAIELVFSEYVAREDIGERPSVEEYYLRFPQFESRLRRMFEVDELIRESKLLPQALNETPPLERTPFASKDFEARGSLRNDAVLNQFVGPYRILNRLGRGGMGVVYRAHQASLNRFVAIKVLLNGADADSHSIVRFRREAEIIARLQHPGIAQVFEIGQTENTPYIALEYAEHGNLTEALQGQLCQPKIAAQLCAKVARAAHYAHECGVVHRDIKPANILMSSAGQVDVGSKPSLGELSPKLCDFGLASDLSASDALTRFGQVLGTPIYMAPEQARAGSATPGRGVDIYAIGIVLYELLIGRPPFRAATDLETLDLVLNADPISPRLLQPGIARDLNTICLKCLEKNPERRYTTAAALAEDLERWLAGDAILARSPDALERSWRWAKRKPTSAVAIVMTMLTIASVLALAGWYTHRLDSALAETLEAQRATESARVREIAAKKQARNALDLSISAIIDDWLGRQEKLSPEHHKFVESILATYQTFSDETGKDHLTQIGLAYAKLRTGDLLMLLGRHAEAEPLYISSRDLYTNLVARGIGEVAVVQGETRCVERLGDLHEALGQHTLAADDYEQAFRLNTQLMKSYPHDMIHGLNRARCAIQLAKQYGRTSKKEAAEVYFRLSIEASMALVTCQRDKIYCKCLADAYQAYAAFQANIGRDSLAIPHYREALIWYDHAAFNREPRDKDLLAAVGRCRTSIGLALQRTGKLREAETELRSGMRVQEILTDRYPSLTGYRNDLARTLNNLGLIFHNSKRDSEAIPYYDAAAIHLKRILEAAPADSEAALQLGGCLCNAGNALRPTNPEGALKKYSEAAPVLRALLQREPEWSMASRYLAHVNVGLARTLTQLGRPSDSIPHWREASECHAEPENQRIDSSFMLGHTYLSIGNISAAIEAYDKIPIAYKLTGSQHFLLATSFAKVSNSILLSMDCQEDFVLRTLESLVAAREKNAFQSASLLHKLRNSPDFFPLYNRADFQSYFADLMP